MKKLIPTIQDFSWQPPVLSILDTPPTGIKGERYIVGTGTDDWTGKDNNIAWYDDDWYFTTPYDGMKVYNLDTGKYLVYRDGSWGYILDDYLYKPFNPAGQTVVGAVNIVGITDMPQFMVTPKSIATGGQAAPTAMIMGLYGQPLVTILSQPELVLFGDAPAITGLNNPMVLAAKSVDYPFNAFAAANESTGTLANVNIGLTNNLSVGSMADMTTPPTHATILGRTGGNFADPSFSLIGADTSYLFTTDGDLFLGTLGTAGTEKVYISAGNRNSVNSIRATFTSTGRLGIGTTDPMYPLQVVGRARFNDSVGIDTPPSTFGLDLRGSLNFVATLAPSTTLTATLAGVAGNVDNGTHRYKVTYFTELGDTNLSSVFATITITDKTVDGKVNLTDIPVADDNKVIGRRIYRTKANTTSGYYLLTTLNNNTTTSLQDNVADASLTGPTYDGLDNFTRGHIYLDGISAGFFGNTNFGLGIGSLANGAKFTGGYNFALGTNSLNSLTSGTANAGLGASTLRRLTSGSYNTAIGYFSGYSLTTGNSNTVIGQSSLVNATTGYANSAIGVNTLYKLTTGYINVAIGSGSLYSLTTGFNNVGIGFNAGYYNQTGSGNIFIGYFAGANETGSNKLYIANSNTTNPLIYGEFDNSYLKVNGELNITGDTYWTGSGSGVPYGHMTNDLGDTITITTQDVWVEASSTVWTTGLTNLVTFGDTHYLAVNKAGVYEVIISASISNSGINDSVGIAVMVNGTAQTAGHAHATLGNANTQSSLSTSYILNLSANDQISLGVVNHSGTTNLDLQHASITLKMIGG